MNPDLQKKLYDKYPLIFQDATKPMNETCMCWGLEVDDGWYNILDALCNALTYNYSTSKDLKLDGHIMPEDMKYTDPAFDSFFWKHNGVPQVVADQVKEKFGTLRFYYHFQYDEEFQKKAEKYPKTAEVITREQQCYTDGIIRMAEAMTEHTCEATGKPGQMHAAGTWLKVLNDEYAASLTNRNYKPLE